MDWSSLWHVYIYKGEKTDYVLISKEMLFQLRFLYQCNLYHLLGGISLNGKTYFSALDVGLALNKANVYGWAENVANCQWKDILPDCNSLLRTAWVIEHHGLLQLLTDRDSGRIERNLLYILQQKHFRAVENKNGIIYLEECTIHEGRPFLAWQKDFKISVFRPS